MGDKSVRMYIKKIICYDDKTFLGPSNLLFIKQTLPVNREILSQTIYRDNKRGMRLVTSK